MKLFFKIIFLAVLIISTPMSFAQVGNESTTGSQGNESTTGSEGNESTTGSQNTISVNLNLTNPLEQSGVDNVFDFVEKVVQLAIKIGIPIAAMFIIIAGLMYVTAQGNEAQIKKAHGMFKNVLIATALLLAAWAIAMGIQGALEDILS